MGFLARPQRSVRVGFSNRWSKLAKWKQKKIFCEGTKYHILKIEWKHPSGYYV
jgi:hypothetical protein